MVSPVSPYPSSLANYNSSPTSPASLPARIAILDDNRAKAELLQYYCSTKWDYEVVALGDSGPSGLAAVSRTQPELLLVAVNLADACPRDFIEKIKTIAPLAKLILIGTAENQHLVRLLGQL